MDQNQASPAKPEQASPARPAITNDSINTRTYTIEMLLGLRDDPSLQKYPGKHLPNEINRTLLSGQARKRRFPFITDRNRRKSLEKDGRWDQRQGGKWGRNRTADKVREMIEEDEQTAEPDELEDVIDPNEPEPEWKFAEEEDIKHGGFEFTGLNRTKEREMFVETGQVPNDVEILTKEEYAIKTEEQLKEISEKLNIDADELKTRPAPPPSQPDKPTSPLQDFLSAGNMSHVTGLPSMPDSAVDANSLEQPGAQERGRQGGEDPQALFMSLDKPMGQPMGYPFGSSSADPRQRELEHFRRREAARSDNPRELGSRPGPEDFPRRPPKGASPGGPGGRPPHPGTSPIREPKDTPVNGDFNNRLSPQSSVPPLQKLENILYEIVAPVRPCVGGQFFASCRPLSNKELYDYSPKFKEMQDSRHARKMAMMRRGGPQPSGRPGQDPTQSKHRQIMRHNMNKMQRQRLMMAKYAEAKRLHETFPGSMPRGGRSEFMRDHRDPRAKEMGPPPGRHNGHYMDRRDRPPPDEYMARRRPPPEMDGVVRNM